MSEATLITQFRQKLHNDLSVSLAREMFVTQVRILQFLVVHDCSVMYEIVIVRFIEMRMSVVRGFASAGGPPRMPDPNIASLVIKNGLFTDHLHTVLLDIFLAVFSDVWLGLLGDVTAGERYDPCTVISTVLEKGNSLLHDNLSVIGGRDNADDSTARVLAS